MWRRLLNRTIWAPHATDRIPARYRNLVRIAFPVIYAINLLVYGLVGALTGGSAILQQALPMPYSNVLLALLGLAGLVGLVGAVFGGGPRTRRGQAIERVGVLALIPTTVVYLAVLILSLFVSGDPDGFPPPHLHGVDPNLNTPLAAIVGSSLMVGFAVYRTVDLSIEIGNRQGRRSGR